MERRDYLELALVTNLCQPIQGLDSLHKSLLFDLNTSIKFTNYLFFGEESTDAGIFNKKENSELLLNNLYKRMSHSYLMTYPKDGRMYDNVYHYFPSNLPQSESTKKLVISEVLVNLIDNPAKQEIDKDITEAWKAVSKVVPRGGIEAVFLGK